MITKLKKEKFAAVSVKAFVVRGNKVLVLRESFKYKGGSQRGNFVMPGGKVNEGEHFASALRREVKEECGLKIKVGQPFHVDEWRTDIIGKPKHIVAIYFYCSYIKGKIKLNDEFDSYEWIKPKRYNTYKINSAAKRAFASYLKLSPM